jgi:hypothetical protein
VHAADLRSVRGVGSTRAARAAVAQRCSPSVTRRHRTRVLIKPPCASLAPTPPSHPAAPLPPPSVRSILRSRSPPANHSSSFPRPQSTSRGHVLSKPAPSSPSPRAAATTTAGHVDPPRPAALRPNSTHPSTLGEPLAEPSRLPGRDRRRLAGIWPEPHRPRPRTQLQGSSS